MNLIPRLLASISLLLAPALSAEEPEYHTELPEGVVPVVEVAIYVIDVTKITGSEQSYEADISTLFRWKDERLAKAGAAKRIVPLSKLWNPNILLANLRNAKNSLPEELEIQEDGTVLYRQRWTGSFSAQFDLKHFPNDVQSLPLLFVTRGYRDNEIELKPYPDLTGRSKRLSITDWQIGEISLSPTAYEIPELNISIPAIRAELPATRYVGYYLGTVFITAGIIVSMAWLVFWLDPSAHNPRVSVSVTSMLTLIAHRFVIQRELPKLPYLTSMDFFLLGSTLIVLLGLVCVVIVLNLYTRGEKEQATRVNFFFRCIYPLPFIGLLLLVL
ncbi:MAG: hypothetical protein ACPGKS_03390 [Coraliomargarita sp.]